jgi:hypothetical protein
MFSELPIEIQEFIFSLCGIECHVCQKKILNLDTFHKKVSKFYFCSVECYNFN